MNERKAIVESFDKCFIRSNTLGTINKPSFPSTTGRWQRGARKWRTKIAFLESCLRFQNNPKSPKSRRSATISLKLVCKSRRYRCACSTLMERTFIWASLVIDFLRLLLSFTPDCDRMRLSCIPQRARGRNNNAKIIDSVQCV